MKIGVMVPLLFLFFLSSCSFIPEYTKPDLPIPEKFPKDGVYTNINFDNSSEVYNLKWQEFFTDEKLKKIILRCENLKKNFRSKRNFKRCIIKIRRRRYFRFYWSKWSRKNNNYKVNTRTSKYNIWKGIYKWI